jgi:choice-of-anchor A domain-containing protein
MQVITGLFAIFSLILFSLNSHAGLLNYNLVVKENLNGAFHVEGASFIGGNLYSTQMSEFNHKNYTPFGFDGLSVAENVGGKLKVMHGETALYKTKSLGAELLCVGSAKCSMAGADLSAQKSALSIEMNELAKKYLSLSENSLLSVRDNQVKLIYSGIDDLAVFNIHSADIFFQNSGIELILGKATKAIINVSGDVKITNSNLNGKWNYSNTLWNFHNAKKIDFNSMAVKGTVLAHNADVRNSAGFDGALYAKSYSNSSLREIHGYFWTPPQIANSVSEPSLFWFIGCGLCFVALWRKWGMNQSY